MCVEIKILCDWKTILTDLHFHKAKTIFVFLHLVVYSPIIFNLKDKLVDIFIETCSSTKLQDVGKA